MLLQVNIQTIFSVYGHNVSYADPILYLVFNGIAYDRHGKPIRPLISYLFVIQIEWLINRVNSEVHLQCIQTKDVRIVGQDHTGLLQNVWLGRKNRNNRTCLMQLPLPRMPYNEMTAKSSSQRSWIYPRLYKRPEMANRQRLRLLRNAQSIYLFGKQRPFPLLPSFSSPFFFSPPLLF